MAWYYLIPQLPEKYHSSCANRGGSGVLLNVPVGSREPAVQQNLLKVSMMFANGWNQN